MASAMANKAIFVGVFIVGVALVYWWSCMCTKVEGFSDDDAKYKFVMYGVDWCPHCVTAKPQFSALGSTKTIGDAKVVCEIVNPEKEPEKLLGKVNGYPTFHLYDAQGKMVKEYNGPRTTSGFEGFLNSLK